MCAFFLSAVKSKQGMDFTPELGDAVSPTPETCKGMIQYVRAGGRPICDEKQFQSAGEREGLWL